MIPYRVQHGQQVVLHLQSQDKVRTREQERHLHQDALSHA